VNAPRVPRTRLATSAVNLVTSPVTAPTHLLRAVLVVVVSLPAVVVVVEVAKSAISAPRSVTLLVTALRLLADMVAAAMVATKVDTVADSVVVKVVKLATPAVVMVTCLVTAPKVKSATTVARLVISPETAHLRPALSALAINASNLATFRLNAQTKPL